VVIHEERLLREGLHIVEFVASRLKRRLGNGVPLDDLKAAGREALVELVRSFDPSRAQFKTYAARRIQWAILDTYRRETHGRALASRANAIVSSDRFVGGFATELSDGEMPTEEAYQARFRALLSGQTAALAIGLVAPVADMSAVMDDRAPPDEQFEERELAASLRSAVAALPERERALIDRHYFGGERFDVIAADLGISKSRASRIQAQAIVELAKTFNEP
jgi:RNA polymerase sigma factor for flagellar operon FliA